MTVAVNEKLRIKLKGYDHTLVDASAAKIVEAAKKTGARVSGPIPLPTHKEVVTILRAVHKYKDSREQFEQRTHKRLIDVMRPSAKTVEALQGLELPAGVEVEITRRFPTKRRNNRVPREAEPTGVMSTAVPLTNNLTGGNKDEKRNHRQKDRHDPDF